MPGQSLAISSGMSRSESMPFSRMALPRWAKLSIWPGVQARFSTPRGENMTL
jgi:hypothetical protein